jgi:hypothetical protein
VLHGINVPAEPPELTHDTTRLGVEAAADALVRPLESKRIIPRKGIMGAARP